MATSGPTTQRISIIVPVLNEETSIKQNITALKKLDKDNELIFVDGGSSDETLPLLSSNNFNVVYARGKGRGNQIAIGAEQSSEHSEILLFLHIDSVLPENFNGHITSAMRLANWGFFYITLDSKEIVFKIISKMMNLRSGLFNIATGDQSLFVKRSLFMNCIPEVKQHPLMEDIYISKYMKNNFGRAHVIKERVTTSTRYWKKHGVIKTIINMWRFRLLYFFGTSPKKLFDLYYT